MINWIIDKIRVWVGNWLLKDELEARRIIEQNIRRRQKEIIDTEKTDEELIDDLENGRF